jgi:hypothetical protein
MADPLVSQVVTAAVEGDLDEAVVHRLAQSAGAVLGEVYGGGRGKGWIKERIQSYNQAARHHRWLVLVDLDRDQCPIALRELWLPQPAPLMCFRVAVRAVEAWLLADREAIASFIAVEISRIPNFPETEPDPKRTLVNLARESRSLWIRKALIPRPGSQAKVGPAYSSSMKEYVKDHWRPEIAARSSNSLKRCLARLRELVGTG